MREIVEVVTTATGVLALLLMGIGALVFILFIELTIARAHGSLLLLKEIGYGPGSLSGFMLGRFVPLIAGVVLASSGAITVLQYVAMRRAAESGLWLHTLPGLPVWVAMSASTVVLLLLVVRSVKAAIGK